MLAEAGAGGEIENPDADCGEHQEARDPDVTGDVVALYFGDDETNQHGQQENQQCADFFRLGCVGIRMREAHPEDGGDHDGDRDDRVDGEPHSLAAEVPDGLARGNFKVVRCRHVKSVRCGVYTGKELC